MPNILLLDDEPLISMLVSEWLVEMGHETVGPVQSVQAALNLITGTKIDCAILDISLGNETCCPVAQVLRDRESRFALSTGYDPEVIPAPFKNELVLHKPFVADDVKAIVEHLLARGATS